MGRIARRFPLVHFCLQVDDLSGTVVGDSTEEIVEDIVEVVKMVKHELTDVCRMQLADPKAAVVATSVELAEQVAANIGEGRALEAGTVVRKLGADYSLGAGRAETTPARRGRRRLARVPRAVEKKARAERTPWVSPKGREKKGQNKDKKKKQARLATRAGRLAKAARRMARVKLFSSGRRRLFATCVLPAACYAAEHDS